MTILVGSLLQIETDTRSSTSAHRFSSFGIRGSKGTSTSPIDAELGLWGTYGALEAITSISIGPASCGAWGTWEFVDR